MSASIPLYLWADLVPLVVQHVWSASIRTWLHALSCKTFRVRFVSQLGWRPADASVSLLDGIEIDMDSNARIAEWGRSRWGFLGGLLFGFYAWNQRNVIACRMVAGSDAWQERALWSLCDAPAVMATDGCNVAAAFSNAESFCTSILVYNWRTRAHSSIFHPLLYATCVAVNSRYVSCSFNPRDSRPDQLVVFDVCSGEPLLSWSTSCSGRLPRELYLVNDFVLICEGDECVSAWRVQGGVPWPRAPTTIRPMTIRPAPSGCGQGVEIFCQGKVYDAISGDVVGRMSRQPRTKQRLVPWAPRDVLPIEILPI